MAFVPIDCLSIPVSSFDSFLMKREFSGEFLCLGVCAPPALEYNNIIVIRKRGGLSLFSQTQMSNETLPTVRQIRAQCEVKFVIVLLVNVFI